MSMDIPELQIIFCALGRGKNIGSYQYVIYSKYHKMAMRDFFARVNWVINMTPERAALEVSDFIARTIKEDKQKAYDNRFDQNGCTYNLDLWDVADRTAQKLRSFTVQTFLEAA